MSKQCPACYSECEEIYVAQPFFRHLDYTTVSRSMSIVKCMFCQTISNPAAVKNELSTFKGETYAGCPITRQTMHASGYVLPVTRSVIQAKILTDNFISGENTRILDIGCFDGSLLLELDSILSKAELWGFDINPHLELYFPKKDNCYFMSTNLEDIEGSFQLITMSHSLIYVPDLRILMESINRLLLDDGTLFIQIPDISLNPCYSLMGDQNFIFTKTSLTNVLKQFGYKSKVINNDFFPRELLIAAQKNEPLNLPNYEGDNLFEQSIDKLNQVKEYIQKIDHPNIAVLGTTVNAAFVDEILGEGIQFFVDENTSSIGKDFRGKKVIHPKELGNSQHIILPYGESSIKIQERFQELYSGTYTIV